MHSFFPIMISDLINTFLISLSPFGEGRVGIPYGILQGLHPILAFLVGLTANLLIFPVFKLLIEKFDAKLWRFKLYKKQSVKMVRKAKSGVGEKIQKYGFWGLMIFVMIPLPVTGAYMGTIAAHIFKIRRRKAIAAISLGVLISCSLMAAGSYFGKMGVLELI